MRFAGSFLFLILALCSLAGGCGRPVEAELLELRGVSPGRVAPGHRLRIEGRGLPIGREAHVRLEGTLHRPGHAARMVDLEIVGTVVEAERLEAPMTEATLRQLGGRGTFRGRVEVAFGSGVVQGRVLGSVDGVILDLVPNREAVIARGEPFAQRIGMQVEPAAGPTSDEAEVEGLVVASVMDGSPAAAAGVIAGDRLLEMDGLRLLSPEELEPDPSTSHVAMTLLRDGLPDRAVATIDVSRLDETIPRERLQVAQLAAIVLLLALAFLGPASIAIDRLSPMRAAGPPLVLAAWAVLGAIAVRAVLDRVPGMGLEGPLAAAVAGRGAAIVLGASGARGRAAALARAATGALAAAAFLGATTLAIGSTAPEAVEAAQGAWPWEWTALRSPVGPLAVLLAIAVAACGPAAPLSTRARSIDDAFLVVIAVPIAIAALGGAHAVARIADVRPALAVLGYLPYALVTALLVIVLRRARDRAALAPTWTVALGSIGIAAAAITCAVGWLELDVPREVEQSIGEVIAIVAIAITLRIATARPPAPARPAHAML